MRIELYTEKTVAQALTALNERMQAPGSATRPALDGWVEKSGQFSLGMTCEVGSRFTRTTYLRGKLERDGSHTTIRGQVSSGAAGRSKVIIFAAIGLIALALAASGSVWMGAIVIPVGAALYIPLTGDAYNSEILVSELQKTLKAKATPPKTATAKAGTAKATTSKPAARKPAAPRRQTPAPATGPLFEEPIREPLLDD